MLKLIRHQGEVEKSLLNKTLASFLKFQTYIVQPAAVIPVRPGWLMWGLSFVAPSVRVDELAAVMVDLAFNGSVEANTVECSALAKKGRELLQRT